MTALPTLLHLVRLSHEVKAQPDAWGIAIYAHGSLEDSAALTERLAAETGFEGVACVDDVARAAVLALRQYEIDGEVVSLKFAERWLGFVEYMQMPDGRFANFILDWDGRRNERGRTSHPGGGWWSARALWALGTAFQVTGMERYRRAFIAGWPDVLPKASDLGALFLMGALEFLRREPDSALEATARALADVIAETVADGYLIHHAGEREIHMWGYDQVAALVAAARYFDKSSYLTPCRSTAETVFQAMALDGPFRSYPSRTSEGICAYDVSCACRGLAALAIATGDERYVGWFHRLVAWFKGDNPAGEPLYHRAEGRCHDGIDAATLNPNCGAESAIEAGLVELERRRLALLRRSSRRLGRLP